MSEKIDDEIAGQPEHWDDLLVIAALDGLTEDEMTQVREHLKADPSAAKKYAEYRNISHMLIHTTPIVSVPEHLEDRIRQAARENASHASLLSQQAINTVQITDAVANADDAKIADEAFNTNVDLEVKNAVYRDVVGLARQKIKSNMPENTWQKLASQTTKVRLPSDNKYTDFLRSLWLQPARGFALASIFAILALGMFNLRLSQSLSQQSGALVLEQQKLSTLNDILLSPNLITLPVISADPNSIATGRLVCAPNKPGIFTVTGLPKTTPDRPYQLMLTRKDTNVLDRVATFEVDAQGNASLVVRAPMPWRQYYNVFVAGADASLILTGDFN
jgi:hypothetical protein